ncbi:MAG TPA: VOC family protein [Ilumatobacter sp.]|nr:VOC family protein [Ilumatobacter sp.]
MDHTKVSAPQFDSMTGLDDWRYELGAIHASFRAGSFPDAAKLAAAIADAAEAHQHHPDIDIRYPDRVIVRFITHAVENLTQLDVDLARVVAELAVGAGATSEPTLITTLELAIDAIDIDAIRPFWTAVLGYRQDTYGNLVDPLGRGPALWFQQMDEPRPQRNRIHFDISVPHDVADDRIAAALAAGGTMVSDRHARAFWVLADAEGNEICVCTWQDRS